MSDETKRTRPRPSEQMPAVSRVATPNHPLKSATKGLSSSSMASAAWLAARGLFAQPDKPWSVDIVLGADRLDCRLTIHIRAEEWSFELVHGSRGSAIRISDMPTVLGRDDHNLLAQTPSLKDLGAFVRELEARYHVHFQRAQATITSSIAGAEPMVRAWVVSL